MAGTGHLRTDLLMWRASGESRFGAKNLSYAAVSTAADAVFGPAGAAPIRSDASAAQLASPEALAHRLNALPAFNDLKLSGAQRAVQSRGEACFRRVRSGHVVRFECRMRQSRASSLCNVRVHAVPLCCVCHRISMCTTSGRCTDAPGLPAMFRYTVTILSLSLRSQKMRSLFYVRKASRASFFVTT